MRKALRTGLALAGVTLLLAGGCSNNKNTSTTLGAPAASSSAPSATTTITPSPTSSPPTSAAPAKPAVAEAGGWRLVITSPTSGATIGPDVDLCYELTGPAQGDIAFDVALVIAATGTTTSFLRVGAAVGPGSARINFGSPDPRFYDMTVQAIVNGQRGDKLALRLGVRFAAAPPAGCP